MNSKIFKSISDRQTIANAYGAICESEQQDQIKPDTSSSEEHTSGETVMDFIAKNFPKISDDAILALDNAIAEYVGADDIDDEFTYLIPDVEVEFHVENDGIGPYEFWGHEEYDRGHDYACVDGCDEEITDQVPDGTKLVFADDYDSINERANEEFGGSFDWEDEDGRGTYSSFSTTVKYQLVVTETEKFRSWVNRISEEKGIPLDGSDSPNAENSVGESIEPSEEDEYDEYGKRIPKEEEWLGRGRSVNWNYVDILKYTKSFMKIKEAVDDILYHKLWDMQFAEGDNRKRVFDEAREELDTIRKESGRWAPNNYLPGYAELMKDIERLDGMR